MIVLDQVGFQEGCPGVGAFAVFEGSAEGFGSWQEPLVSWDVLN